MQGHCTNLGTVPAAESWFVPFFNLSLQERKIGVSYLNSLLPLQNFWGVLSITIYSLAGTIQVLAASWAYLNINAFDYFRS